MSNFQITPTISILFEAIKFTYIRASGPGGQNVNKLATAAQLRFDASTEPAIKPDVLIRLRRLAGSRMTAGGVIIITARRFRSQERNRQDALERLANLIAASEHTPLMRRASKPNAFVRKKRYQAKKHRSRLKSDRQAVRDHD